VAREPVAKPTVPETAAVAPPIEGSDTGRDAAPGSPAEETQG